MGRNSEEVYMMIRPAQCCALVLGLLFAAQGMRVHAQLGRATVTGIVWDPSGAVAPGIDIIAVNQETGVKYHTKSNTVGVYTIGALPVGIYDLNFSGAGFKEFIRRGIALATGQIVRLDVTLEIGDVSEKVTVTEEVSMLQTETAETTTSVSSRVFNSLPLSFSGGRNMQVFADALVPGVQGTSYAFRIEGTPQGSQSVVIDGMSNLSGFLPGDFAEASISPEAIQEMTVHAGNISPEYGRAGGGVLSFTLKSGANQIRGSAFYYLRNEFLNANDWNNNRLLAADPNFTDPTTASFKRPSHRRAVGGVSGGGPVVLPKLYDGRDRTFFYFTLEKFKRYESGPSGLTLTAPQPEMLDGDLSRLLTGRIVGTDILGRPVTEGQLYDPMTLRQVNGQWIADPFLGNIIPPSRISKLARTLKPIYNEYYPPVTTALTQNLYASRYYKQIVTQGTLKMDHSFSSAHKVAGYFYWHAFPRWRPSSSSLWSLKDPDFGGPLANVIYQKRRGYNWNVNYNWVVSPTVLNHASFGVNYNGNLYKSNHAGRGYHKQWGIKGVGQGLPDDQVTSPELILGGSPVVTFMSMGSRNNRDFSYRGYIFTNTLSWQRQSHTLKVGFEWNRMTGRDFRRDASGGVFSFSSRTTSLPGYAYSSRTGNSFASFLLGLVDWAYVQPVFDLSSRRDYAAVFVQDNWKATARLTLTFGLRWSGNSPIYESQDRMASFNPTLPDPLAPGMLGAVEYMGFGPGRSGRRSAARGHWKDFGPSLGFAYRVTSRVVMRGGYGITFTPEALTWDMIPANFAAGFRPTNLVPANSQGLYRPVFNIDDGFPGAYKPANLDPSWGQFNGSVRVSPDYTKAGYVQHFNFGFQTEVSKDLLVEVDWRATKGTRLHNWQAVYPNQIRKEELVRGEVLGRWIASPADAAAAGLPYPYPGFRGTGANTLMPFPQINTQSLSAWGDTNGFSTYHSANLVVTKRMSYGVYAYGAYTFSKAITDVQDVTGEGGNNTTTGLQDTYNKPLYKSISPDDRTHVLKAAFQWELPVGKGRPLLGNAGRILNAVVGGWGMSAILRYSSGAPLGSPTSRSTPVGWNGPAVRAVFNTPVGGFKRLWNPSRFNPWNPDDPGNRFFDPSAFSDAPPQQIGNTPMRFPQLRLPSTFNESATLWKHFRVRERAQIEFRLELLNALNRHYFAAPHMNRNQSYFGNIIRASGGRIGQLGVRMDW